MPTQHHSELVRRGLLFHEGRRYEHALPLFEEARALCPTCPNAAYNVANTLHMLGRNAEACDLLRELINASDEDLLSGCDDLAETPRSLRLDAQFLLFLCVLDATGEWRRATPFLRQHIRNRSRGVRSLWSKAEVIRRADELRASYSPRSRPVAQWAV